MKLLHSLSPFASTTQAWNYNDKRAEQVRIEEKRQPRRRLERRFMATE
jgi:hypothetical protein